MLMEGIKFVKLLISFDQIHVLSRNRLQKRMLGYPD